MKEPTDHDLDFFEWTQRQSAVLRSLPLDGSKLDAANLAEEIEALGLEQNTHCFDLSRSDVGASAQVAN
jgi:hypothetical protein